MKWQMTTISQLGCGGMVWSQFLICKMGRRSWAELCPRPVPLHQQVTHPSQWCVLPSSGRTGKKHAVHVGFLQLSIRSLPWVQLDGGGALGWFSDLLQLECESPFPWSSSQWIASRVVTIPSYEDGKEGVPLDSYQAPCSAPYRENWSTGMRPW